jgi:hypothetical protein
MNQSTLSPAARPTAQVIDLANPQECAARAQRIENHTIRNMTRLDQINKANDLRTKHGIHTEQDLLGALNNLLGAMSPAIRAQWADRLTDITCDIEGPPVEMMADYIERIHGPRGEYDSQTLNVRGRA